MSISPGGFLDFGNNGGVGTSISANYTPAVGSNLFVLGILGADVATGVDDIASVTYGGAGMNFVTKAINVANANKQAYLYYFYNPPAGSSNVVITASTSHWLSAMGGDYSGAINAFPDAYVSTGGTVVGDTSLTSSIT